MCGEQSLIGFFNALPIGSPPRVRGTAQYRPWGLVCPGITPACAGNRTPAYEAKLRKQDHPRVCGEQKPPNSEWKRSIGSPPRVRGTARSRLTVLRASRITPACAGNSRRMHTSGSPAWDHPRVCGEQGCPLDRQSPGLGSPPRVRGTAWAEVESSKAEGITPACAGNRPERLRL